MLKIASDVFSRFLTPAYLKFHRGRGYRLNSQGQETGFLAPIPGTLLNSWTRNPVSNLYCTSGLGQSTNCPYSPPVPGTIQVQ